MKSTKPLPSPEKAEPIRPLLRLSTVLKITGLARSTIYRMIAEHTFPAPVRIGKRAVAWRPEDLGQWRDQCPSASAP